MKKMKTKILFIALMTMTMSFAQTNKAEINQIIKEQSDGIVTSSQKGVSTVYNDGTSVVKTVYNDVKSLSPKVESAIAALATELKTTTNALWVILVRQQLVWSICFLILTLASILNWFLFYKRNLNGEVLKYDVVKKVVEKLLHPDGTQESDAKSYPSSYGPRYRVVEDETLEAIPTSTIPWFKYVHLTICIGLSGLSVYHFSDMLTGFINPEFGALKTIVEVATKLK
jgi:hypothetical protein